MVLLSVELYEGVRLSKYWLTSVDFLVEFDI